MGAVRGIGIDLERRGKHSEDLKERGTEHDVLLIARMDLCDVHKSTPVLPSRGNRLGRT